MPAFWKTKRSLRAALSNFAHPASQRGTAKAVLLCSLSVTGSTFSLTSSLADAKLPSKISASEPAITSSFYYCVPANTISLYPFRPYESGYDVTYLLALTRSYISKDPTEPALLSKWQFSPDGRILRAEVSSTAKWSDGTPLSAKEAALGIAKGFRYRPIGDRVRVAGDERLLSAGWKDSEIPGIKLIDGKTFEITFESTIANLAGAVREALSTNARHNRVWPARLSLIEGDSYGDHHDLISKFPLVSNEKSRDVTIMVASHQITFIPSARCPKGDFHVYGHEITESLDNFTVSKSKGEQSVQALLNSQHPELASRESRLALASWVIQAYSKALPNEALSPVYTFFLPGEPGYSPHSPDWRKFLEATTKLPFKRVLFTTNNPIHERHPTRRLLSEQAKRTGVILDYERIGTDASISKAHILVDPARIEQGRHVWMQDALVGSDYYGVFLKEFRQTTSDLRGIAAKSASTVPVDNVTLQRFATSSFGEVSVIPVGRVRIPLFSRTAVPVEMRFTEFDEITFIAK